MKELALALGAVFATALAPAAFGQYDGDRYDRGNRHDRGDRYERNRDVARVIESRPVRDSGSTRQECWNPRAGHYEELRDPGRTNVGKGAAIGAVTGGVLGHQVDSGTGTAAGAVLGGILGHQVERRRDRDDQPDLDRSRCRFADGSSGVVAYDVRYEYDGREYIARMERDPGNQLVVGRDINPDGSPFEGSPTRDSVRSPG